MNKYEVELQRLKAWDRVQYSYILDSGYNFINTGGHGYLVVPITDKNIKLAKDICKYGFKGELAIYLEEDSEAGKFEAQI